MKKVLLLLIALVLAIMMCGYVEDGRWMPGFICLGIITAMTVTLYIFDKGDTEMSVNINVFLKQFEKNYEFLYNAKNYVAGYDEAVEFGDEFIKQHPDFVKEFCKYRGDLLTSDREVASFAFTLDDLGLI